MLGFQAIKQRTRRALARATGSDQPDHRRIVMASCSICSIPDCGKAAIKRGWCQAHYRRWQRHGDPLAGRTPDGAAVRFLQHALSFDGDECLQWPYARVYGYGRINLQGRSQIVSRVICEEVHGAAPSPRHEAAHSCGNGRLGCVNPKHISWKTPEQNAADKLLHGTHNRGARHPLAKLTEHDARQIFNDARDYPAIAAAYGISIATVYDIKSRRSWACLSPRA